MLAAGRFMYRNSYGCTRTYDPLGRVTQLTDNMGYGSDNAIGVHWTYAWSQDSAEQTVTEKLYFVSELMGQVTSVLDEEGRRIKLTYPNSRELTFAYDNVNRLDEISEGGAMVAEYDYKGSYLNHRDTQGTNRVFRLDFDNGTELGGYDAFGRIVWMKSHRTESGGLEGDNVELAYGYDTASNPVYRGRRARLNVYGRHSWDRDGFRHTVRTPMEGQKRHILRSWVNTDACPRYHKKRRRTVPLAVLLLFCTRAKQRQVVGFRTAGARLGVKFDLRSFGNLGQRRPLPFLLLPRFRLRAHHLRICLRPYLWHLGGTSSSSTHEIDYRKWLVRL